MVLYYVDTGAELFRWLALSAFAFAALSDGIDGYIARRYNQHSELGKILDPLADKLLLVSGIVLLSLRNEPHLDRLPLWLTGTVIGRDVLLLLGLVIIHYISGRITIRPVIIGKVATVLQMSCVLWALFKWNEKMLFFLSIAAALCTGISGVIYIVEGLRQLSASPSSSAAPKG
jgi:cardiolipin synthase